jgi:hypothetical protein
MALLLPSTPLRFRTIAILAILFISIPVVLPSGTSAAQEPAAGQRAAPFPELQWGEVADGLQVSIGTGVNTESLTETTSLLYLTVQIRNVSQKPVSVKLDQATYDFEYEIDGTWYAFERMAPVRTPLSVLYASSDATRSTLQALAPGSARWTMVTLPLAGRSRSLQLHAVTAAGPGRQFEPRPGPHVVRIRPGRAVVENRQAPVSNAVTVSLRTPAQMDTRSQSISFTSSEDAAFRELRFVAGPADERTFIREMLARPPNPASAPQLITAASLEFLAPLPFYELVLPRRVNAPNAPLPGTSNVYHYLVRASGETVATIGLTSHSAGSVLSWVGPAGTSEPVFDAVRRLAGFEQVRGGGYEPRLVRVTGVRGTQPVLALWLRSSSGRPDLFYRPRDPEFRGVTKVELEKLYTTDEFLMAARTLPLTPKHDEAWAITTASACAKDIRGTFGGPLISGQATAEVGLGDKGDRIVWYVSFPERMPEGVLGSHSGAAFYVDESNGACQRAILGG